MKKMMTGMFVVAAFGLGAPALAGGAGQDMVVQEDPQQAVMSQDSRDRQPEYLEYLSPEVTPDKDAMTKFAAACGTWLADPDPSWPTNTSAYSNGAYEGTGTSCSSYGTYGYQFQCVEYVQRYFFNRWNVTPKIWYGNATDLCNTAPSSVRRIYDVNAMKHGDAVVLNWGVYGHTAIVDYATSTGCYSFVEQNGGYGGRRTICPGSAFKCGLRAPGN